MKILRVCDVGGSKTMQGNYSESWWICSNRKCKKNNSNWSFEETFAQYKEEFNKLDNRIKELSRTKVADYYVEIELHEFRWIGDGSGNIKVKNNSSINLIKFYFDKDKVEYITDDIALLKSLSKIEFDLRLKEMWKLMRKRNSILNIIK
ncbi:hypothetical protein [Clostridium faecium]|uniref:Uncharacterized protein n=1 Tax=Clostridium faecium TaxID=2762223 RepID=A0ABR8YNH0_9CLOT|nr:hypothetical protein [Clostridium faecium]MBD8045795.1 hypothetical protein [Clostridium faecium]